MGPIYFILFSVTHYSSLFNS